MDTLTSNKNGEYRLIEVNLIGRFMLPNKQEFACKIKKISLSQAIFSSVAKVEIGHTIIAYIDQLGRIEGSVNDIFEDGFKIGINATVSKRDNLAAKLTWIMNREELGIEDQRRQKRMIPIGLDIEMRLDDGQAYKCKLLDLSIDGAAFDVDLRPKIGTHVTLGKMSAHVVRHLDTGIAVEFTKASLKNMPTNSTHNQQKDLVLEPKIATYP